MSDRRRWVPSRLRNAIKALALTEAHAAEQRHQAALLELGARLERNGLLGPLSGDVEQWAPFLRWAPPGHFYSPIPKLPDVLADAERIWTLRPELPGIDVRAAHQLALVERIAAMSNPEDLRPTASPDRRFHLDNDAFGIGDATALQGMLQVHAPARIVEIGSGFSSALMLDVLEEHLPATEVTFVDPHADLLRSLLRPGDDARCEIVESRVQDLDLDVVRRLGPDDILFVDSTHTVRTGNDVCYVLLELLPTLAPGVLVHVHDIFWPFEPPLHWVEEGRAWAECYLVRALLTANREWEIVLFNDYLRWFGRDVLEHHLPQVLANAGGSLWLRRTR